MKPDWGNVPAWIGALSLLLAFRIFLRDRTAADRAQVDVVGVWWEVEREFGLMTGPRVETVKVRTLVRNGSDLPLEVTYIAWEIHTRWFVPDFAQGYLDPDDPMYPGVWSGEAGTGPHRLYIGPIRVPPQQTWEGDWQEFNIAHLAPENASQLDPLVDGVRCALRWSLVTDNAGRRWQTRHQKGRRARPVRWYTLGRSDFPYAWKNPAATFLAPRWNGVKQQITSGTTAARSWYRKRRGASEVIEAPDVPASVDGISTASDTGKSGA